MCSAFFSRISATNASLFKNLNDSINTFNFIFYQCIAEANDVARPQSPSQSFVSQCTERYEFNSCWGLGRFFFFLPPDARDTLNTTFDCQMSCKFKSGGSSQKIGSLLMRMSNTMQPITQQHNCSRILNCTMSAVRCTVAREESYF